MLIDVLSKEQRCFPDLEGVVAYLRDQRTALDEGLAQRAHASPP
jgi:hypothetical protein